MTLSWKSPDRTEPNLLDIRIKDPDKGFVSFKKQRDRKDLTEGMASNAHELWFAMSPDLPNLIKKKSPITNFDLLRGWDDAQY